MRSPDTQIEVSRNNDDLIVVSKKVTSIGQCEAANASHWNVNEEISFINGNIINNQLEICTHKSNKTASTKPPKSYTTEIVSQMAVL